jgi:hypothetical protein
MPLKAKAGEEAGRAALICADKNAGVGLAFYGGPVY